LAEGGGRRKAHTEKRRVKREIGQWESVLGVFLFRKKKTHGNTANAIADPVISDTEKGYVSKG